ncbi:MAG: ribosome assembly factor SBDS, partial [Candidatus Hadarchaeum sp.]|nr:ribosome assembly factor SBDS [Candidatus Hadarchaeum sp.]
MVKLEDAVVARLSSHSTTFEILVDPELAMAVKSGQSDDIRDVLALDKVFKDAKKGDKAADEMVQKV